MGSLTKFRRDPERASAGRWCVYQGDIEIKIASTSQEEFQTDARRIREKMKQEAAGAEPTLGEYLKRLGATMATHLVRDWRGIETDPVLDEAGKVKSPGTPIPFSISKARDYLCDPEMQHFREWVFARASEFAEYQVAATERDAKN